MNYYRTPLLSICLFLTSGCIIPWPHWKQTSGSLCGRIVIEDPNQPVNKAELEIQYSDGGHRETTTDEYGFFYFPEKKRFCWGILFGVALNHSLPLKDCVGRIESLHIEADDYDVVLDQPEDWRSRVIQPESDSYLGNAGCIIIPLEDESVCGQKETVDDE